MGEGESTRRDVLKAGLGAALALGAAGGAPARALPRWRGFNLLHLFQAFGRSQSTGRESEGRPDEEDFQLIAELGFDFVRIPMDYWFWIDSNWRETRTLTPDDALKIDEAMLERIDSTVELGRRHGLHVSLNLHRAPGYCINNNEREPFSLWTDPRAEEAFCFHWKLLAERYRAEPVAGLSFNLVNEAPTPREGFMTRADYARVMTRATEAIRAVTPDRVVIVDGLNVGNVVADELEPLGVAQSVHAYSPAGISHFRASWVDRESKFPEPSWPLLRADGTVDWDRARLERHYAPWGALADRGIGVHCGEGGGWNRTPHPVFLAWMEDVLDILKGHRIGWALWNFRGGFGVLDSGRQDVAYEDWHGHQLDRKLLELLQRS